MAVYYCIPPEDALRTKTCSGSNDRGGEEGLLRSRYHSEINYLRNYQVQDKLLIIQTRKYSCYNIQDTLRSNLQLVCLLEIFFEMVWQPLWSSGQGSQRSGFDSRRYQMFWEVVGLERDPLSLVSTTEELLGRKSSCFGIENRKYDRRVLSRWPRGTLYPQKLALTSPTSGGGSVCIVRLRTQAMEFCFMVCQHMYKMQIKTPYLDAHLSAVQCTVMYSPLILLINNSIYHHIKRWLIDMIVIVKLRKSWNQEILAIDFISLYVCSNVLINQRNY
jgi:hypothetical protein